jgi:hypothetical protein
MRTIISALVTVILAGCAAQPQVWTHSSASAEDFERDKTRCYYEGKSQAAIAAKPGYNGAIQAAVREVSLANELGENCMFAKGYTKQ